MYTSLFISRPAEIGDNYTVTVRVVIPSVRLRVTRHTPDANIVRLIEIVLKNNYPRLNNIKLAEKYTSTSV